MERDRILKKLKDIKDPRERDRIIWALAGREKEEMGEKPPAVKPTKIAQDSTPRPAQRLPGSPTDIRKLVSYFFPGIFIFFGLVNIVQAAMHYNLTGQIEDIIPRLIMGGAFILIGIFGIAKAKKQVQSGDADHKET
ncbi:MAG: hypothetical protein ABFD82_10550 [Syntrophaceae bacterium]